MSWLVLFVVKAGFVLLALLILTWLVSGPPAPDDPWPQPPLEGDDPGPITDPDD